MVLFTSQISCPDSMSKEVRAGFKLPEWYYTVNSLSNGH